MNFTWFSLMWRAHVSTKTRGTEDCKEFLLTEPTKRYKHVSAVCTCTCSLLLYCTSRQSNLMITRKYFWQPSRLKPCLSCLNMVPSVLIRTCFWKSMAVKIPHEASLKTAAGRSYKNMIISDCQNLFQFRRKLLLNGKVGFSESGTNCHFFSLPTRQQRGFIILHNILHCIGIVPTANYHESECTE